MSHRIFEVNTWALIFFYLTVLRITLSPMDNLKWTSHYVYWFTKFSSNTNHPYNSKRLSPKFCHPKDISSLEYLDLMHDLVYQYTVSRYRFLCAVFAVCWFFKCDVLHDLVPNRTKYFKLFWYHFDITL